MPQKRNGRRNERQPLIAALVLGSDGNQLESWPQSNLPPTINQISFGESVSANGGRFLRDTAATVGCFSAATWGESLEREAGRCNRRESLANVGRGCHADPSLAQGSADGHEDTEPEGIAD